MKLKSKIQSKVELQSTLTSLKYHIFTLVVKPQKSRLKKEDLKLNKKLINRKC